MFAWNINGVKNKFLDPDYLRLIPSYDILVISETHFGQRLKCPDGFCCVSRSKCLKSKKPRGGVALFKRKTCMVQMDALDMDFRDCVVVYFRDCDVVMAAIYIPPSNSIYFDDIYFTYMVVVFAVP